MLMSTIDTLPATAAPREARYCPMGLEPSSPDPFSDFRRVVDPAVFTAAPDDHLLALADIVDSTSAVAAGRYRSVNMAGAAFICAAMNAIGRRDLDFAFGGDGAFYLARPAEAEAARRAAAETAAWAARAYGLDMRVSLVPVAAIRAAGRDVRIARFCGGGVASFAMFAGGGATWAESEMKAGRFRIDPAADGVDPDLAGLSCRWQPFPSRRGTILSLIVVPAIDAEARFNEIVSQVLALIDDEVEEAGRPLPERWPYYRPSLASLRIESRTASGAVARVWRWLRALAMTSMGRLVFATGLAMRGFDPAAYWPIAVANSDYRKYADGLRMTIDCAPATADRLAALLAGAARDGAIAYGLSHQQAAQMTCIVPSMTGRDHIHFIDGAGGGYAAATAAMRDTRSGP